MEAMKAVAKTPAPLLIPWRQTEIQFAIKCSCFPSCTMKLIIKKPHFKFSLVIEIVDRVHLNMDHLYQYHYNTLRFFINVLCTKSFFKNFKRVFYFTIFF